MARLTLLSLLAILSACNTCLDAGSVPFDPPPGDSTADVSLPDAGDAGDDDPDTMLCDGDSDEDACREVGRECGVTTFTDICSTREVNCGECPNTFACTPDGACVCAAGYVEDPGSGTCLDVDECLEERCSEGEFCINLPGSFRCSECPDGQVQDGGECVDLDECAAGEDTCDPVLATCTNEDPGFLCTCNEGYTGNGEVCADIDECDNGTHDCDPNAVCQNLEGSFDCGCRDGFQGDGRTCLPNLINQVQFVDITTATSTGEATIPAGMNAAQVVPFATARNENASGQLDSILVDVWVDVGSNMVRVSRGSNDGSVDVRVALVEFVNATVQAGTMETSGVSDSVAISAVDVDASFLSFSYEAIGIGDDHYEDGRVRGDLLGSTLQFNRDGFDGEVKGHWYVVEANDAQFTTEHLTMSIAPSTLCGGLTTTADPTRSFLLYSYAGGGSPDPSGALAQCRQNGSQLECCRGNQFDGSANHRIDVKLQVVQFASTLNGFVSRGITLGPQISVPITPAQDPQYSSPIGTNGAIGAVLAPVDFNEAVEGAPFVTQALNIDGSMLQIMSGEVTPTPIEVWWQVVTWPH